MYCAIIGDIIRSKEIEPSERYAVQERLKALLQRLNHEWDDLIEARFLVTLGDEFQGLLKAAWPVVDIIREIQREMWPTRVRFGIGYGEIYTKIDRTQAIGADGEAFYRARDAIESVKKAKMESFGVMLRTGADDVALLDGLCGLMDALTGGWSDKQRMVVWIMEETGETQKAAAAAAGRTPSSMNTLLHNAKYKEYEAAAENLSAYLRVAYDFKEEGDLRQYNQLAYLLRTGAYADASRVLNDVTGSRQDIAILRARTLLGLGEWADALAALEEARTYDDGIPDLIRYGKIEQLMEEAKRQ